MESTPSSSSTITSRQQNTNEKDAVEQPEEKPEEKKKKKKKLPPFFDHFNSHDLKILIRCSVAFWVTSLFIFIQPTLINFGTAAFFGCIVTLFLPPSGVIFVFLLGSFTMLVGMGLGWAWGVITEKAALATRPAAQTLARTQQLGLEAQRTGTNAQVLVYNGFMLDNRVTVTYFCMLLLFIYFMARLRMAVPKLALTAVFGWIVTDVFLTIGPLLPSFSGTIPAVLIKPAAAAIGVNVACALLIFPESTSHLVLSTFHKLTNTMVSTVPMTKQYLETPSDAEADEEVKKLRAGLIAAWGAVEPPLNFLPFDISIGYWGAHDIEGLKEPVKRLLMSCLILLDARLIFHERSHASEKLVNREKEVSKDSDKKPTYGKHQVMESLNLHQTLHNADVEKSVGQSFEALDRVSRSLMDTCAEALTATSNVIEAINSQRWFSKPSEQDRQQNYQDHTDILERLRQQSREYHSNANQELLHLHDYLFDSSGTFMDNDSLSRHKLTGLFIGFTVEESIGRFSEAVEKMLSKVVSLESQRTRRKLWMPTGLSKFFAWVTTSKKAPSSEPSGSDTVPELDKRTIAAFDKRLNNSSRPARKQSPVSKVVLGIAHWLSNDDGVFAMRIVVASLAVGVIAVTKNTAGFFYREKGLWGLIMAQTGLALGFADFTYGVITRIGGTLLGGVIGMVAWYCGSGLGRGNPYGLAAVMAVVGTILMYFRLYAPPQHTTTVILSGATLILVIGYGYVDGHNPSYGNPGFGYEVFYRRTVLVIIGFAVGAIVSLLPWPTSQSRSIAKSLAGVLHAEADHYALLLSSWNHLEDDVRLIPAVESVGIHLATMLTQMNGPIGNLRFEFSSSAFDTQTCTKIKTSLEQINRSLTIIHILGASLPRALRDRFAKASGLLHHRATADVMVTFAVIEQALKTGDALPSRLPTPLVVRCIEHGHSADVATLTKEILRDRQYRRYTVIMGAYLGMLGLLDDLVLILKEALGEAYVVPDADLTDVESGV